MPFFAIVLKALRYACLFVIIAFRKKDLSGMRLVPYSFPAATAISGNPSSVFIPPTSDAGNPTRACGAVFAILSNDCKALLSCVSGPCLIFALTFNTPLSS
jgi:hypothetical protein